MSGAAVFGAAVAAQPQPPQPLPLPRQVRQERRTR